MGRTSTRAVYNLGVRWIAENTTSLTQVETSAVRLLASIYDCSTNAVARHVFICRSGRAFRQFPLPKRLTLPEAKRQRWIG